jgi:hypothetical protein
MPEQSNQAPVIPVEVRNKVREWLVGTYGRDHSGVPLRLIEKVKLDGLTIYRLEVDVTVITTSPRRETVYLAVTARSGAPPQIDQDTVVFFAE